MNADRQHPARSTVSGLRTRSLAPTFGREVLLDVGTPSIALGADLRAVFDDDGLLFIRDVCLDHESQRRLVGILGPTLDTERASVVSNVPGLGVLGGHELAFHSDLAFTIEPYRGISLYAVEVDEGVAATRFADCVHALDLLPGKLRRRIDGLEAVHVYSYEPGGVDRRDPVDPSLPSATHPVVMAHPATGRPLLFVNEHQTHHIVGMTDHESRELLGQLFTVLYRDDNVYEHAWRNKDLVIWDNLAVQHARSQTGNDRVRTLSRVVLAEHDLVDLHPDFQPSS